LPLPWNNVPETAPTASKNKSKSHGAFFTTTQTTINSPQSTINQPQILHKKTTKITQHPRKIATFTIANL
jgi:hypothetical protein